MSDLARKECVPCQGGVPPIEDSLRQELIVKLNGWEIVNNHHLSKTYAFSNYAEALDWVNRISQIAEQENHHPDVFLAWGQVRIDIWTHKIDNLTESDFILAAKFDSLELSDCC